MEHNITIPHYMQRLQHPAPSANHLFPDHTHCKVSNILAWNRSLPLEETRITVPFINLRAHVDRALSITHNILPGSWAEQKETAMPRGTTHYN